MDEQEKPKQSKESVDEVSEKKIPAPKEPKKEPSKFGLFLRQLLRWTTAASFIFTIGIITTFLVRVRPLASELDNLESQLALAIVEIEDLEYLLLDLPDLENANIELGTSLEETRLHLSILSLLVDVSTAEIALSNDSPETAQAALAESRAKLNALSSRLDSQHSDTISAMQDRLTLAIDGITEDVFAAQSDLEVLRNSILALERSLFGN